MRNISSKGTPVSLKNAIKVNFLAQIIILLVMFACQADNPIGENPDEQINSPVEILYKQIADPMNNSMDILKNIIIKGEPDFAFSTSIIQINLGAINMSLAQLENGNVQEILKIAENIVKKRKTEINKLNLWLNDNTPEDETTINIAINSSFNKMMMNALNKAFNNMQSVEIGLKNKCNSNKSSLSDNFKLFRV